MGSGPEGRSQQEARPPSIRLFPVGDAAISKTFAQIAKYTDHSHFTDKERSEIKRRNNEPLDVFLM